MSAKKTDQEDGVGQGLASGKCRRSVRRVAREQAERRRNFYGESELIDAVNMVQSEAAVLVKVVQNELTDSWMDADQADRFSKIRTEQDD